MSVVAVMTSVSVVTGSYGTAGIGAALVGVGTAVSGPVYGMLADTHGQRPVLLFTALTNAASLWGLAWALRVPNRESDLLIFATALLIGCTQPQATSMVRARWLVALRQFYDGQPPAKTTSAVLSYESMTDELVFVLGPVVQGLIATLVGVVVPLDVAAVLTVLGVIGIALHPSARYARGRTAQVVTLTGTERSPGATLPGSPAPLRHLVGVRVVVPVLGMLAIGLFFGSTLTGLTSFMETRGQADATGLYYGIMGVSSALCAFSVVALPDRVALTTRWLAAGSITLAGAVVLNTVLLPVAVTLPLPALPTVVVALLVMGTGIGPALVTLYSIAAQVAPHGRTTTVMAMMATAVTVGQASASAIVGNLADARGYGMGYVAVGIAATALVVLAVIFRAVVRAPDPVR